MFGHHTEILVPAFVVSSGFLVQLFECKCSDVRCQLMRFTNLHLQVPCVMLIFNHSNNHAVEDQIRLACVSMWLGQFSIRQSIVAIVKLGDISAKILLDRKLATRMNILITIGAQH